jgi:hypothetical protein
MPSTCPPSAKRFGEFMRAVIRDGWLAKNKLGYSGILMKLDAAILSMHTHTVIYKGDLECQAFTGTRGDSGLRSTQQS